MGLGLLTRAPFLCAKPRFRLPSMSGYSSPTLVRVHAPVAQRIEHLTTDQKVRGSSPLGRASKNPLIREWISCFELFHQVAENLHFWNKYLFCTYEINSLGFWNGSHENHVYQYRRACRNLEYENFP